MLYEVITFWEGPTFELYDLAEDLGESHDLAARLVHAGLLLREAGARLRERDLEGRALDPVEIRAGGHALALAKELALDDARNACAHLHRNNFV